MTTEHPEPNEEQEKALDELGENPEYHAGEPVEPDHDLAIHEFNEVRPEDQEEEEDG